MQELLLESDRAILCQLRRGDLVGARSPNVARDTGRQQPIGGRFWYYRGVVEHRHRDGAFTVRIYDDGGIKRPLTFRFDVNCCAVDSSPVGSETYMLVPWTESVARWLKIQKLEFLCYKNAGMWSQLSVRELDEAIALATLAFDRYSKSNRTPQGEIAGPLGHVLSVYKRAELEIDDWRYRVIITNTADLSGMIHIYPPRVKVVRRVVEERPMSEHLFASPEECASLLAVLRPPFPSIPADAIWHTIRHY